jgi:hypothetical protein
MPKSNPPSNTHKEWAKHLRAVVGGTCAVQQYWDEAEANSIAIFTSRNDEGIVAATIGLMEFNQSRRQEVEIFSEIIMERYGQDERIANILSTLAYYAMKDKWQLAPGIVFQRMVEMYIPETKLPHVLFTSPFQWEKMSKVELTEKTLYPLLAVRISEAERQLAKTNDGQDLEQRWADQGVDVLDWQRQSTV